MKALKNHLILFDAECPMCRVYTRAFVSAGILEDSGRASYQEITEETCPLLDRQRAVNEIALVNQETGEVSYGIRSLFKVFASAFPLLGFLFRFEPFIWLMSKVYAFIAFNRRVIVPPPSSADAYQFQPTFRLGYRIVYLIFTWWFSAYTCTAADLFSNVLPAGEFTAYYIFGGLILFQGLIISILNPSKRWNYLGNMMTVTVIGALLVLPLLLLAQFLTLPDVFYFGYYICVAVLIFLEHIRRSSLQKLSWIINLTWLLYQLFSFLFYDKINLLS